MSDSPVSIAIATDNSFWVADTGNQRVQHFGVDGRFISHIQTQGIQPFTPYLPQAVAVAKDNSVWIADPQNNRLQHFHADGHSIGEITFDPGIRPQDLDFSADGTAWILAREESGAWVYTYNSVLYRLGQDGKLSLAYKLADKLQTIVGSPKTNQKIALVPDGSLWVSDVYNNILHMRPDGSEISRIENSYPDRTRGFAVMADNSLWLTDWLNHRVQHFTADGSVIAEFGSLGAGLGQFRYPQDLALANDGSVWVIDTGNHRLQKFRPKTLVDIPAEYDALNQLLYIDDVAISSTHYQATLQLQHNYFRLLTLLPAVDRYANAAHFDDPSQILTIPVAQLAGRNYQGQFNYLGGRLLQLKSVTNN